MPQDAFTLRINALELNAALSGGRINRINQPSREELSFIIYTGTHTVKLVLNTNARDCGAYFTEDERENPLVAPGFCMLLRKHLQSAEILEVSTLGFERILCFKLLCTSDFSSCERVLYAEIMGKYSNLILTEKGVVLGALKMTSLDENCKRAILAGVKYTLPAPQDKVNPLDFAALQTVLKEADGDRARFLFTHVAGLAPSTAEMIVSSYKGGDFAKHVYDFIFSNECEPCVTQTDFFARKVEGGIPFPTLSAAQTYFYTKRRAEAQFAQLKRKLESAASTAVKKHEKRLALILERKTAASGAEENRVKGELLTANLYRLEKGMKSCVLDNYYDGTELKITLDPLLTPNENAQQYYKKYRKQKRTLEALEPQEREVKQELDYAESLLAAVEVSASMDDLRSLEEEMLAAELLRAPQEKSRKKKAEIPYRTFEKNGFRIFAGRNNLQNDRLVKSSAENDIWLHTQKYHSCHVVIKTEGKKVPDEVLLYAAEICVKFSSSKGGRVPVDYCPVKFVKKPPKAKAGFVVYTDYKTVLVDPPEDSTLFPDKNA
ncbi:MAG: NFACT family protein [Clostridia bacterium]|nr:NFACT family protein [Clostridia bacterium]